VRDVPERAAEDGRREQRAGAPAELGRLAAGQRELGAAFLGGRGWGLGTSVVREGPWAGAFGWDGGLGTSFLVHPERDLAVIVLTSRMFDSPQTPAAHTDLQTTALAAVR
jgi:CubicO group peptidase (beta-lactamase class C family)